MVGSVGALMRSDRDGSPHPEKSSSSADPTETSSFRATIMVLSERYRTTETVAPEGGGKSGRNRA